MIVSMPPLRIFWPTNNAYELDHGSMEMPRAGQSVARSAAYPLGGGPDGFAEEHIEHWTASTTGFTDVGKTEIGSNDGSTNKSRSGFIDWLSNNPTLAVQYAHRRVFRFDDVDGTDSGGNSVVPDPGVAADALITIKRDGAIYAYGLRRDSTTGARVVWKLSQDLLAGHVYEFESPASAQGMTAQQFIDNKSGDPGYLSTVAHAYYEDIADFPGGPGTGGGNVPND